ncbi:MAG: hypothetical protein JW751_21710 [Polyangiaceae bacterium]|nr:hypothetical protein [Polyangiaceae bacterium]
MKNFSVLACLSLLGGLAACIEPTSSKDYSDPSGTGGVTETGGEGATESGGATTGGTGVGGIPTGGTTAGGSSGGTVVGGGGASGGSTTGGLGGAGATETGGASTGGVSTGGDGTGAAGTGGIGTGGDGTGGGTTGGDGGVATGGVSGTGATSGSGGALGGTGGDPTGGTSGTGGQRLDYELPPPSQCHNEDDYQAEGCIPGDASTLCGGKCNVINACLESTSTKPYADITVMCPRDMLFSPEMEQAAIDDGNTGFHYAVVGHDSDTDGIDSGAQSTCCQCYQLVYAYPSPANELQCQVNPTNPNPPESAIAIPKPLIVQSFNTAATPHTFDVYMAAGGLGANNACAQVAGATSISGEYMYTSYPEVGQPGNGGVKPVTHYTECKTQYQWVTQETLSSPACQAKVEAACNEISSDIPGLTEQSRSSCIASNDPDGDYHLNWSVYVMKVECPEHLTRVTGCKLAPQGLPAVDPSVTTAAQAAAHPGFQTKADGSKLYETTTMEDCCRPSCASRDWIDRRGLVTDPDYNSFYTCDLNGVPITEDP